MPPYPPCRQLMVWFRTLLVRSRQDGVRALPKGASTRTTRARGGIGPSSATASRAVDAFAASTETITRMTMDTVLLLNLVPIPAELFPGVLARFISAMFRLR